MFMKPNNKKVLFLYNWPSLYSFIKEAEKQNGVSVSLIWNSRFNRLVNVFWKTGLRSILPILFAFNPKTLIDYDMVIVPDSRHTTWLVDYLHRNNPHLKIIVWVWNTLWGNANTYVALNQKYQQDDRVTVATFDLADSRKYGLLYVPNFYFSSIVKRYKTSNPAKYSTIFVGVEKGRGRTIQKLRTIFEHIGQKAYFHVVPNRSKWQHICHKIAQFMGSQNSTGFIPYEKILKLIDQSRSVLDISNDGQSGMTLRVMEALFFEKKLITTNQFVREMDFYNPRNVLIVNDTTNEEMVRAFLEEPYEKLPANVIQQYDFSSWLDSLD